MTMVGSSGSRLSSSQMKRLEALKILQLVSLAKQLLEKGLLNVTLRLADYAHDRLIKYYTRLFGFKAVREVGGGRISDIPHLLVWGGVGTRMDGNLEVMLRRCSRTYSGQTSK